MVEATSRFLTLISTFPPIFRTAAIFISDKNGGFDSMVKPRLSIRPDLWFFRPMKGCAGGKGAAWCAMRTFPSTMRKVPRSSHRLGWRGWAAVGASAALLLAPNLAQAHSAHGETGGFFSGFAHPLSGLDHVTAMVAVGLWGAQLGRPAIWLLPIIFPLVMAFGGFLALVGLRVPGAEMAIALSAVGLGAVVLAQAKPPLWAAAALVGVFGLFHGYAHGAELPPGQNALLYSLGFILATGLLHLCGVAIGLVHRWPWGRWALRGAGAVVCVCGLVFLKAALA